MTSNSFHESLRPGWRLRTLQLWPYISALGTAAIAATIALGLRALIPSARVLDVLLAGVVVAAVQMGTLPAVVAATFAFAVQKLLLPPHRLQPDSWDLADLVTAIVFLGAAIMIGRLGERYKLQAHQAVAREKTTDTLFRASRELASTWEEGAIRQSLARYVGEAAAGEAVVRAGERGWPHPASAELSDVQLFAIDTVEVSERAIGDGWWARRIGSDDPSLGIVAWRGADFKDVEVESERLIGVLVDLGAASIERARLGAANAEMEALTRTERLRQALLSSVSHDFRTPLAATLASITTLRNMGKVLDESTRDDLLLTIEEETRRLNRFVTNLLRMSRLEAGELNIEPVRVNMAEVVDLAARRFEGKLSGRKMIRLSQSENITALGDPVLLDHVLVNVLENAVRFSPERSMITLSLIQHGEKVTLEVEDQGPGVSRAELSRIFEKFYQSPSRSTHAQGVGLGLSIAKGLIESMGGEIAAACAHNGTGLRVCINLPQA
jgi:two-component system sensor histidine kinase KdpD